MAFYNNNKLLAGVTVVVSKDNPYEASTPTEMAQYLNTKYYGCVVKYTGTTGTYTQNTLYVVTQVSSNEYTFKELLTPTGSITIDTNGEHNVKNYEKVNVNVPATTLTGDATEDQVLAGKTFYSNNATKKTGTMLNVGQEIGIINNKTNSKYNIAKGYHDGSGYVQINASQIADCVAGNILQGKTILGVAGTLVKGITPTGSLNITANGTHDVTNYASVVVNVALPTLNAPTISLSGSTLTITNPSTNGNFVSGYKVYNGSALLATIQTTTIDLSNYLTESGTYTITVKAYGTNFNDSAASSSVSYVIQSISYTVTITQLSSTFGYGTIDNVYDGQNSSGTLLGSGAGTYTITSGYLYIECSTANGGNEYVQAYITGEITEIKYTTTYGLYKVTGNGTIEINVGTCLTGDTLITLANGNKKRIDEITLNDKVLAYNPNTMKLEEDNIIYCDSNLSKEFTEYDIWTFENGTIIKTVHRHRLYNVEKQRMVYMDEWQLGEHAINIKGERIELLKHENIKEKVNHYTIFTKNQNYFANGLLAGNRYTKKLTL